MIDGFNSYINDVLAHTSHFDQILCADDTNLFFQSKNLISIANIQNKWPPQQWPDYEINFVATNWLKPSKMLA